MMQFFRKNVRSIMLVIVVLFVVSCFAGYGMYSGGGRGASDGNRDYAVAKVDGKKIMRSKIETDVAQLLQSMGMGQNVTSEDYPAIRKSVLEQMAIMAELEKEIKSRNIKVVPASVDEAYAGIQSSFPTQEIFMQQMQQAGLDEKKLKENITEQLKQRMLFDEVMAEVSVDQTEVRSYYDTMKAVNSPTLAKQAGFTMNLAHFSNQSAAQKAYDDVSAGKKWDDTMKAAKSGDVLDFIPYEMPVFIPTAQLTDKAAYLKSAPMNAVTKPVEIASGDFMLAIKRTEQKAGTASFDEISGDIEMMLRGQKGQALQSKFIQDLKARASIEILDEELFKTPEPASADVEPAESEDVTDEVESADEAVSADQ